MKSQFSFGGDEHLLCQCAEEMSMSAFFKSLAATRAIRESEIAGVLEVCGGNTSYLVRFDPDLIHPDDLRREIEAIDSAAERSEPVLNTRIIDVPVYYQDPWTHETMMAFRERHQEPDSTDLEYAAKINGFPSVAAFIQAHHGSPWFVSQVGFVCGCPWLYQMVERERQIEAPKYVRPRTDTPRHTIGYGGCFTCIYAVRGAGGYQMFGITPMPIFDSAQAESYLQDSMVLGRPGDIFKFRPIEREEYDQNVAEVEKHAYEPIIRDVKFDLAEFEVDIDGYNRHLSEVLYGD
jgi:urea carboxylase